MSDTQVWFVTGANKGLGAAIAKLALEKGHKVVAAARNPEAAAKELGESPNLYTVRLDLTDAASIRAAAKEALDALGRVDVLVNNAGYGLMGYFEEFSESSIRKQMETNVFGPMSLAREFLPTMRRQGSGWVINVSSTSGVKSVEGGSIYSASKFALEGWTEGLTIEMKPFGICCMLVEPGGMRTDFFNPKTSFTFADLEIDDYATQREELRGHLVGMGKTVAGDPNRVAKAVMQAMQAETPPLRLLCGRYAAESVDKHLQGRRAEFDTWRYVSESTDFDQ